MINLSLRLQTIADLISSGSSVIDIGCDHGFLDIYLTKFKKCKCLASDISKNVLENTKKNINNFDLNDKIDVICSDGLSNINTAGYDTIVVSGMGTSTILDILNTDKISNIDNFIIQSNNDLELLRRTMVERGFCIFDEKIVFDKGKYYVIIFFKRGVCKYLEHDYLFGPIARLDIKNMDYYKYLLDKNLSILDKLDISNQKYLEIEEYILKLKKFTCLYM